MVKEFQSEICEFQKLNERKSLIRLDELNQIHSELLQEQNFEAAQFTYNAIELLRSQLFQEIK